MRKKGDMELKKIIGYIILLLVAVSVIALFFMTWPKVSKFFNGLSDNVFGDAKKFNIFGDKDSEDKKAENLIADFEKEKDCSKKRTIFDKIDADKKEDLKKEMFDCYLGKSECSKAESFIRLESIRIPGEKQLRSMDLIRCYSSIGDNAAAINTLEDNLDGNNKKEADFIIAEKENLKRYKEGVTLINSKEDKLKKDGAIKLSQLLLDIERKKSRNNVQESIIGAIKFWLAKNDKSCGYYEDINPQLEFPHDGIEGSYYGENIGMVALYEKIKCKLGKGNINYGDVDDKIVELLRKYPDNGDIKKFIASIADVYDSDKKCAPLDNKAECDAANSLLGPDKNDIGIGAYRKLICYYFGTGSLLNSNKCVPCSQISICDGYTNKDDCINDPCETTYTCSYDWLDGCKAVEQ